MSPGPGATSATSIATLPEVVITLHRNGTLIDHNAGQISDLSGKGLVGIETLWQEPLVTMLRRLARKAIAVRGTTRGYFEQGRQRYELEVNAQGPDRATCSIRSSLTAPPAQLPTGRRSLPAERKDFLRRLQDSIAHAALRERPLALAMIHVDGIVDIGQILDPEIGRQIMSALLLRLPSSQRPSTSREPKSPEGAQERALADPHRQEEAASSWYVGEIGNGLLAQVLESTDRDAIDRCVAELCASLREPIRVGGCTFHLTPYAGVAVLGQDASAPRMLLIHARRAVNQARAAGSDTVCFFTDTLKLKSLARLDLVRELRQAIARRHIRLRYSGRHDLTTDRRVAYVGYLRWQHPLRGEIRPSEFVRVAETTGLALDLSRSVLQQLKEDYAELRAHSEDSWHISFGALRHHVLHEHFIDDIEALLADGTLPADRLELRIAEKTFINCEPQRLQTLQQLGVRLVVDEVGRGMGSLDWFARFPAWGLQLDRAWVTALRSEDASLNTVALKVCRAAISVARALGLEPIATGIDNLEQRNALLALGCSFGAGDLYRTPETT